MYYFFTDTLNIEVVRLDKNLCGRLYPFFLSKRDDEWLSRLYNLLSESSFDPYSEIIKTETGKFVCANTKDLFLRPENADDLPVEHFSVEFVSEELYKKCQDFFDHIAKIKRFNALDAYVKYLESKYSSEKVPMDKKDLVSDTRNIIQRGLGKHIRAIPLILCDDGVLRKHAYFPTTKEAELSAKLFYANIGHDVYDYVDLDFYQQNGISPSDLESLGVWWPSLMQKGEIEGIYETGNPGRPPRYKCVSPFWWNMHISPFDAFAYGSATNPHYYLYQILNFIKENFLDENAKEKSGILWRLLLKNESHLRGTVTISKEDHNYNAELLEILNKTEYVYIKGEGYRYAKKKWLFTTSGELVSPTEISKHDLDTKIYGEIKEGSSLYDWLNFKRDARDLEEQNVNRYRALSSSQKDTYWRLMAKEKTGKSIEELENLIKQADEQTSADYETTERSTEYINRPVKNLTRLKSHTKSVFCNAPAVQYKKVTRSERITRSEDDEREHLRSFYAIQGKLGCVCQMCGKRKIHFESCELLQKPQKELPPMNLCLCLDCAMEFRRIRKSEAIMQDFLSEVRAVSDTALIDDYPIQITLDSTSTITFSQTHLAEIIELLKLQEGEDDEG